MFCKRCGTALEDDLLCPSCGFQNTVENMAASGEESKPIENIDIGQKQNTVVKEIEGKTDIIRNKLWVIISGIMFIISLIPFYKGYDKMTNYYSSDYYSLSKNAYVGGDAYNYIINAGYATAFFVLAVGFAVLGVGFLIVYYVSGEKVEKKI